MEVQKIPVAEWFKQEQVIKNDLKEGEAELDRLRISLGEEETTLRSTKDTYLRQLQTAQNLTGDDFRGM